MPPDVLSCTPSAIGETISHGSGEARLPIRGECREISTTSEHAPQVGVGRWNADLCFQSFDRPDRRCPCDDNTYYCELPGFHCNMLNIVNKASNFPSKAQPGGWNDLDMLEVGNGGMTDNEYVAHMSLWALMKSPLIMGNNLDKITAQSLSILMNPAVIAINQDPAGSSGQRVWRFDTDKDQYGRGEISLWTGGLANGDQVVALLNAARNTTTKHGMCTTCGPIE